MAWVVYQDPSTFNMWYFNPTATEARWHWPPLFELPFHVPGIHRMDSEVAATVRMALLEDVAAPERARMAPEVVAAPSKEAYAAAATPDETYTSDDLRRWIQWHIWLKYWVWIELKYMWLNVVSQNDDGKLIHHRQLKHAEQVLEVLRQVDQPQIEVCHR